MAGFSEYQDGLTGCNSTNIIKEPPFSHASLDNLGFTGSQAVPYQGMGV